MKAGFGRGTVVFPQDFFPQEGFCGIHEDPHIRLMVLTFAQGAFALLEGELVIIPKSAIERWRGMVAEAFSIPYEQTVVQMTHAITTPHEPGPLGPPGRRPEPTAEDLRKREIYHRVTDKAVEEAIAEAKRNFGDAMLGWGAGECQVNVSCDLETSFGWWVGANPAGYSNHRMTVLQLTDPDRHLKGLLVSYGMKPAAIDNAGKAKQKRLVSPEIAGLFCDRLENKYGVPVLYAVSAGGNQIPKTTALYSIVEPDGSVKEIDLGPEAGLRAAEAQAAEMAACADGIIQTIEATDIPEAAAWKQVSLPWTRRRGGPRKLLRELVNSPEGETELTADLVRFGDTALVLVRPEMTAECEKYLQERSPVGRTLLLTLTNGEMKCLPDRAAYDRATYEAQGANLMPGAAEALLDAVLETIRQTGQL